MLALAIVVDPSSNQNNDIYEWISYVQSLLYDLAPYSTLAAGALHGVEVICNYAQTAIRQSAGMTQETSRASSLASRDASDSIPIPSIPSLYLTEQATPTLVQPQPSVSNLLGQDSGDVLWATMQGKALFARTFPGFEVLCGNGNTQELEVFLSSCITV